MESQILTSEEEIENFNKFDPDKKDIILAGYILNKVGEIYPNARIATHESVSWTFTENDKLGYAIVNGGSGPIGEYDGRIVDTDYIKKTEYSPIKNLLRAIRGKPVIPRNPGEPLIHYGARKGIKDSIIVDKNDSNLIKICEEISEKTGLKVVLGFS